MSEAEIFATVKKIAVEELDVEEDQVTMEANIKDDLEADSLGLKSSTNWKTNTTSNWTLMKTPRRLPTW
jgi:hypothetical protein